MPLPPEIGTRSDMPDPRTVEASGPTLCRSCGHLRLLVDDASGACLLCIMYTELWPGRPLRLPGAQIYEEHN